jgi:hypothetical protein
VKRPEDVYDMMLTLKVCGDYAKTYGKVAEYFEYEKLDYRKSDKVYRMGLEALDQQSSEESSCSGASNSGHLDRELRTLESLYERFCERMKRKAYNKAIPEFEKI